MLKPSSYDIIAQYAFGEYLEIGVQEGGSMYAAMTNHKTVGGTGIDTWGIEYGGTNRGNGQHVMDKLGVYANKVRLITGDSKKVLPTMLKGFDTIYIDGDHSDDGCLFDLEHCLPLLNKGGIIIVDDVDHPQHPTLRDVVVKFAADNKMQFKSIAAALGMAILKFDKE